MKIGDMIKVAFVTNGDISVIYYGQDTDSNFGYLDLADRMVVRTLVLDKCRPSDHNYWICHYADNGNMVGFREDYIKSSAEWLKNH